MALTTTLFNGESKFQLLCSSSVFFFFLVGVFGFVFLFFAFLKIETQFTHHKIHSFKIYNLVIFSIVRKLCSCHYHLNLGNFHFKKKSCTHYQSLHITLALWQSQIYFVCFDLPYLNISYK